MKKVKGFSTLLIVMLVAFISCNFGVSVNGEENSTTPLITSSNKNTYANYINSLKEQNKYNRPDDYYIVIEGEIGYEASDDIVELVDEKINYNNSGIDGLYTPDYGSVSWNVNVEEAGLYNILLKYYPIEGKSSAIERGLYLNDKAPFSEALNLIFHRVWGDEEKDLDQKTGEFKIDTNGNHMKPSQIEKPVWREVLFTDDQGYYVEPYLFYFEKGENKITLDATREPMIIDNITLFNEEEIKSYSEIQKTYQENDYQVITDGINYKVQGEHTYQKSSPTLYPINDRISPLTEPYHTSKVRLNAIGGYNWRVPGEFISWEIDVKQTGLYNLTFKALQNFNRGSFSTRSLSIDGKIPFEEAKNIGFVYSGDWKNVTLGNEDNPYFFYLEEGKHVITLEVTLGDYGLLINQVEQSIASLNELYRKIITVTGVEPDPYRDYQLRDRIPDLMDRLNAEKQNIQSVIDDLVTLSGERSSKTAVLSKLIIQLEDFIEKPRTIPERLRTFKDNVAALGTWILEAKEQPLSIDYLVVHSNDYKLPRANANFGEKIWHELMAFIASFTEDYNSLGGEGGENNRHIDVWVHTGRDQATIIRQLIDESFTPETNISVTLKIVNPGVLLPATLAKLGPDISMFNANNIPVNYAMRNAVYDISQFDDFNEIASRFHESAMVPYEFNDGYYALPETQIFPMLFYRKDIIIDELGLEPPKTWDDVISIVPVLQRYNYEFYLPLPTSNQAQMMLAPNSIFASLLYQHGGQFYTNDGKESTFNTEEANKAFIQWTNFYTSYKFPLQASFPNRFRTGEMPIGVMDYSMYNVLSVFAPEIRNDWDFVPIPGMYIEDKETGELVFKNESASAGTNIFMLKTAKDQEASWEYMKWWTDTETQVSFGREMEGVLGAAARYPTANLNAVERLPWPTKDYKALEEQWRTVRGIPEIPGGYMVGRHIDNAFREVINNGTNPREALYDYNKIINEEIKRKRKEFGLDI